MKNPTELETVNERRVKKWCGRINQTGSLAQCLIAAQSITDDLHICIEPGTKMEDVEKLLVRALEEVRGAEANKGGAS